MSGTRPNSPARSRWAIPRAGLRLAALWVSAVGLACLLAGCGYGGMVWGENLTAPYLPASHTPQPKSWPADRLTLTWIGHATVFINFYGTTILTDPVLTERLAPHLGKGVNLGIRRITALPLKFDDLPPVDVVLLSHAHHDHWDEATLEYFGPQTAAVIPEGNRDIIPAGCLGEVTELAWGQETHIKGLTIRAFRVEHWGARFGAAPRRRGFNGYVISGRGRRVVFFGDTAYYDREKLMWALPPASQPATCPASVDWAARVNVPSADVCLLPIGDSHWHANHASPEEAWSIFQQVHGRWFLPLHWRTFILTPRSIQPIFEPIERLRRAARRGSPEPAGGQADRIICDEPGATFTVPE